MKKLFIRLFAGLSISATLFAPFVMFGASVPVVVAVFQTSLQTSISESDTSMTLVSGTNKAGNALAGYICFNIDEGTALEEFVCGTAAGTAVTGMFRGIDPVDGDLEVTALKKSHRRGASVKITDYPSVGILSRIFNGIETIPTPITYASGVTPSGGSDLADKEYVLSVVSGGTVSFDQVNVAGTAGETIVSGDIVYLKTSDSRWWKADADDTLFSTTQIVKVGIAQGAGTAGGSISSGVLVEGIAANLTGLTANTFYYLSNTAGAVSSSVGTYTVPIGNAISTTQMVLVQTNPNSPSQAEKAALPGAQGVVGSANKYITQDAQSIGLTDQSQTTQNGTSEVGEADATTKKNKLAQSFIPTKTKVRGVELYKSADTGTFTGTVTVSLQADTTGSPSGTPLATVTFTNAQWLLKSAGAFEAIFSTEYASAVAGSLYWIVIETSTSDNSNHPNIGTNTAGGYASGSAKYKNVTDSWVAISTIDLYFKTLEGTASQVVKTNTSGKIEKPFYDFDVLGTDFSVGPLSPTYTKSYFTFQLPFILWTGSTSGAATTDFTNWVRTDSTTVFVSPNGTSADFRSTGAVHLISGVNGGNASLIQNGASTALKWSDTNIVVMDWWAKLPATSTGSIQMGIGSSDAGTDFQVLYTSNPTASGTATFAMSPAGALFAHIGKAGVGVTNTNISTGVTTTNWNNYRIVLDLGTDAKFYVNGVLKATLSGANLDTSAVGVLVGAGRSDTALFQMTQPTISIQMNP